MSTLPYTYFLARSTTGMKYYGVRYAKNCDPSDLWHSYKTSSKHVKNHVFLYGDPDIVEVRKTFNSIKSAQKWEHKVLKRLRVVTRSDYLNRTDNHSISPEDCAKGAGAAAPTRKGRTKFNHPGVARAAYKLTGRSKKTHQYLADHAKKLSGRNKETHFHIAEQSKKLTGRTKETHSHLEKLSKMVAKWSSKQWEITYPNDEKIITFNISEWCRNNNFPRGSITTKQVVNGYKFAIITLGKNYEC